MLDKIAALPKLRSTGGASGRIARLEERVDLLTRLLGGLYGGAGIDIQAEGEERIRVDCINAAGTAGAVGFLVGVDGQRHVQVAPGTAQAFGGDVTVYDAADLGSAGSGGFVYAILDLTVDPVEWYSPLEYGPMTNQPVGEEMWVPIARIERNGQEYTVTQLHWGNIVVPAVKNAVDVQQGGA